jgi:hypothetical protein
VNIAQDKRGIYRPWRARCNNNGHRFDYRTPTHVRRLANRARGAGFLEGQATALASEKEYTYNLDSSIFIEHIFNPVQRWTKMARILIQVAGRSKDIKTCDLV